MNLQTLTASGGTISLTSGSLSYIGNLTIGSGGIFGNGDVSFGNNQQVTLTGTTTVDPAHVNDRWRPGVYHRSFADEQFRHRENRQRRR